MRPPPDAHWRAAGPPGHHHPECRTLETVTTLGVNPKCTLPLSEALRRPSLAMCSRRGCPKQVSIHRPSLEDFWIEDKHKLGQISMTHPKSSTQLTVSSNENNKKIMLSPIFFKNPTYNAFNKEGIRSVLSLGLLVMIHEY